MPSNTHRIQAKDTDEWIRKTIGIHRKGKKSLWKRFTADFVPKLINLCRHTNRHKHTDLS